MDERRLGLPPCPGKDSPSAAGQLGDAAASDSWDLVEELLGATDRPHGCSIESDGVCPHGWRSAALTMGMI
jgi:hypothetical protein